jgi:hypothetical protein
MAKPSIAEIHLLIEPSRQDEAYRELIDILKHTRHDAFMLTPLYVTRDRADAEVRICVHFEDPARIERFIVERVRPIDGMRATRVRLTLHGEIFQKGMTALMKEAGAYTSCHVFIKTTPRKDNGAWDSLRTLKDDKGVMPVWIFRDFYEYDRDITLRLLGNGEREIRAYIEKQVNTIDGITLSNVKFMLDYIRILEEEKLYSLAKAWFG